MAIYYDDSDKIITLHTKNTTYQMQVDEYDFLLHLYYGRKTAGKANCLLTYIDHGFSGNPYDAGMDRKYSLDALPQELPCQGTGDFRSTAVVINNSDGSYSCDFRYKSHRIYKGKYKLPKLPAVYADEAEAETIEIELADRFSGVSVTLYYGVLDELDIITRSACIRNEGKSRIYLKKAQAACLDFISGSYDMISFYGRHAMERNFQRIPIGHVSEVIGSRRGASSHQYNPFVIIAEHDATEAAGSCYALNFVYSGEFRAEAELDQINQTRVLIGLQSEQFSYPLEAGEGFYVPETIMTFSASGFEKLSHNLHECIREHICRGNYRDAARPILLNSWEASYFNFNGESIYTLAKQAAQLGIEMLVLDDGWFGKRDSDNSGLGDWCVNEEKLGMPLEELSENIHALGLKFGIWIEPEAVNEDSELYRRHPDWALKIPGRDPIRSRNEFILDFSRPEIVDYIFEKISQILDRCKIEYVKWDMNRSIADYYSIGAADQGRVKYDYILGLYRFLERLLQRYPELLIEGCSGGGGRFDTGMLYYTPQIWCSDNTDAIDRIRIQYGTSFGYPISAIGAHVSAVPNHQTGRTTPFNTRGIVAMMGGFGYELDPDKLSDNEKEQIKQQINDYKRDSALIHNGKYYRLTDPFRHEIGAWEFLSEDGAQVLVNAVMLEVHGNMAASYIRLRGLTEGALYREESSRIVYGADALMEVGIPILPDQSEYQAFQLRFVRID